ncbi:Hypothetical predicted protein [Paramuricea clavata]|uniref:Uncharacterized protein n=2 Tax=Paramuricea clavata TaxID=317549 RepID=A0A6S7IWG0_PARCT|nr:Hypothetical predicted protein [Paramuricea clavata]
MSDIDSKPLHPKNKLLLYSRYVLSKLAWHFTVATLSKTWVTKNIDSIANKYIRRWLEVPISGTLSTVFLTNNKFGLSIYPPSVKFIQCQTVLRKALKSSPNESTNDLWRATSNHTNIQYDAYNSTKEVLKDFGSGHENKLLNQLTRQGSFFCSITKFALPQINKVWSIAQSKLPKNIYNFTIRYINNSLPTRKNLNRWAISSNSDCSFCLSPETLLHILVAGCQFYLDRFTWRHNSVLNFLAHTLQTVDGSTLYADLNGFKSPSILTGDTYRPDLLLSCSNGSLYVVELNTGYETNLKNNVKRKKSKYRELLRQLESLLHVVAGCQCYLDRFTWRHNSILNFLANTLQTVNGSALYADVPGFKSPSIITGDTYRPDLLLSLSNGSLYVVELTVGYETNLENNVNRKKPNIKN